MWPITTLSGLIGFVLIFMSVLRQPPVIPVGLLFLGLPVVSAVAMVWRFTLRLQNRISRLEMQTNLARLGCEADFGRMTLPQIVALRFASDAELPTLLDRAVAENLTADQIKRAVATGQADQMRT